MLRLKSVVCVLVILSTCHAEKIVAQTSNKTKTNLVCLFGDVIGKNIILVMQSGDTLRCELLNAKEDTLIVDCKDDRLTKININAIKEAKLEQKTKNNNTFVHALIAIGIVALVIFLVPSTS